MRAKEFTEARKNPHLNPKVQGADSVYKILSNIPKDQLKYYGVSFNNILKLGINPNPSYDTTPLGVYFYPADYYLGLVDFDQQVPFRFEDKYIHIIQLTTDKIVDFGNAPPEVINKVYNIYKKYQQDDIDQGHEDIINPGIKAYTLLYDVAILSAKTNSGIVSKFNSLLRSVGVDVVTDHGEGYIHENEPYQGVILNPKAFRTVKTIRNDRVAPNNITNDPKQLRDYYLFKWKELSHNKAQGADFINEFLEVYHDPNRLDYDGHPEDMYKVSRRIIAYLLKDPSLAKLGLLNEEIIEWIVETGKLRDTNLEEFLWKLYNEGYGHNTGDYEFKLGKRSEHKKVIQQQMARANAEKQKRQASMTNPKAPVLNQPDQEVK